MGAYTAPFVTSLTDNFATMFGCDVSLGEPQQKTKMHATRDVTGIIGLTGKADGNIVISLDREVALVADGSHAGTAAGTDRRERD